jgi:hypothetical protein
MQKHLKGKNSPENNTQRGHLSDVEVQRYIENDLESGEMTAIQQHLNGCNRCFGLVASVQRENLVL